jgi:hypothetical protein
MRYESVPQIRRTTQRFVDWEEDRNFVYCYLMLILNQNTATCALLDLVLRVSWEVAFFL